MNIKLYGIVLGAVGSLALYACGDSTDSGTGGGGATTSTGGSTSTGGNTSAGGSTSAGGGGGSAGCRTCAVYITDAADQGTLEPTGDPLCTPDSATLFSDLLTCGCTACIADCPSDACPGGMGTGGGAADACGTCLTGTFTADCSTEFGACSNDL